MKGCKTRAGKIVIFIAGALCFVATIATEAQAQGGNARASSAERRAESMTRKREQFERDTLDKDPAGKFATPADQQKALAVTAQVQHDFERIQAVYNQIVITMAQKKALDYKFIFDATAEVKKCATRLRGNLALPQPDGDKKNAKGPPAADDEVMETSLLSLRNHIMSFVTNPLFETSGVLDIELSKKASRDLTKIIELSQSIHKVAEGLQKK